MKRQNKRLGQVFLHDRNILRKIIDSADLDPSDTVIEIGCGDGILSVALAERCKHLHIVEFDAYYLDKTRSLLEGKDNVSFHHCDALKFDFLEALRHRSMTEGTEGEITPFKMVANIPYQISAKLLQKAVDFSHHCTGLSLLVQKEFALKCVGVPGTKAYTSLAVYLQFHFDIKLAFGVGRNCFYPVPEVDSAVITLTPRTPLPYTVNASYFDLVRGAFWGRRKTLKRCLIENPYLSFEKTTLEQCPFLIDNPLIRGETMSIDDFYQLYLDLGLGVKES